MAGLFGSLVPGLFTATLGRLWGPVKAASGLPVSVTRHYLSLLLSAVLYFFVTVLRIQPHGYIKVGKVVELQKVIDHLYSQVELYRGVVRELKDDVEAKESDRRKAISRLKSKKEELRLLNEKLYEARDGELGGADEWEHRSAPQRGQATRGYFISLSFLACVTAVLMFHAYVPGGSVLEWKVVMSAGFPISWLYLGSLSGDRGSNGSDGGMGGAGGTLRTGILLASMWWLVGFLVGASLGKLDK